MSRPLTASDRHSLIRLASTMPAGSAERRAILAGLKKASHKPVFAYKATDGKWYLAASVSPNWDGAEGVGPFRSLDDIEGSVSLLHLMKKHRSHGFSNYGEAEMPPPMSVTRPE